MKEEKIDALLNLLGADSEEDILKHMNEFARLLAVDMNKKSPPRQEDCIWDLQYIDSGNKLKVSKMHDGVELCYMTLDMITYDTYLSNEQDVDLLRIKTAFAYAEMMGMV